MIETATSVRQPVILDRLESRGSRETRVGSGTDHYRIYILKIFTYLYLHKAVSKPIYLFNNKFNNIPVFVVFSYSGISSIP